MKIRYKETIDGHEVVRFVSNATADPEATKRKVKSLMPPGTTDAEFERLFAKGDPEIARLFVENPEYGPPGENADLITDEEGDETNQKLAEMGEHEKLLTDGEYIVDWRGVEYWRELEGKWQKEKVDVLGDVLPSDAVREEYLTPEQQREIYEQQEEERFAALAPEQQAEEEKRKIEARFAEIDRLDGPRAIREAVAQLADTAGLDTFYLLRHEEEARELRNALAVLEQRSIREEFVA